MSLKNKRKLKDYHLAGRLDYSEFLIYFLFISASMFAIMAYNG